MSAPGPAASEIPVAEMSAADLLAGYARILAELRSREVVRSANAPAGDWAEWLFAQGLGGTLVANSVKSYDLKLPDGRLVQVKCRVQPERPTRSHLQTSPFRSWHFDVAGLVLLDGRDYSVRRAGLVPAAEAKAVAQYRSHVAGAIVWMTDALFDSAGSEDVTEQLKLAARRA